MRKKSSYYKNLKDKFNLKKATIAVVGLGYVGLPLLIQFYRKGFDCIGIDVDKKKIDLFHNKNNNQYFKHIINRRKKHSFKNNQYINLTTDYSFISKADAIIICLPTPIYKNNKPNLNYISSSLKGMKKYLKKGQLLSLESTVAPGTCKKLVASFLKEKFELSKDFFLVYSPERENPIIKNIGQKFNFYNTPKICSGYSINCKNLGVQMYSKVIKTVIETNSIQNAEMSKMIENVYRAINIGLVNELKMLCYKMNLNIYDILSLSETKPFGFTKFKPGPGIGGHCIPVDPYYLIDEARNNNFELKFVKEAMKINKEITKWCIKQIEKIFIKNYIKKNKSKILFFGANYKANIDDLRESPSLKFFEYFDKKGFSFDYCDPHIPQIKSKIGIKRSIKLDYKIFKKYKVIILLVGHDIFNKDKIIKNSNLIIDTRGFFKTSKNKKIYFV